MGTYNFQGTPTAKETLEGLLEIFGRTASGHRPIDTPALKPAELISTLEGIVENIGKLGDDHPEITAHVVGALRHCAGNPLLKKEHMMPVVRAIETQLEYQMVLKA